MSKIADKSVDMILCDLPYGTTHREWDLIIPFEPLWLQYKRIIKDNGAILLTASQPFTSQLVMSNIKWFKYEIIWQKNRGTGFLTANKRVVKIHENILVFYKKQPTYNPQKTLADESVIDKRKNLNNLPYKKDAFTAKAGYIRIRKKDDGTRYPTSVQQFCNVNNVNSVHPTQKPVELMEYLIKTYSNEGDTILDNCMGSGTTGVACKKTGRNFIGIDKDKKIFEIAINRIKTFTI